MSLEKQLIAVPLLGLNTLADPKSAAAGEFDLVENMWFNRTARGGAELRKRYGGTTLTKATFASGTLNTGRRLATFGDERLLIGNTSLGSDPGSLYSYSPQQGAWRQTVRTNNSGQGAAPSIGVVAEGIIGDPNGYAPSADVAVNAANTLMCLAYVSNNSGGSPFGQIEVIDLATGERLVHGSNVGTVGNGAGWARVVALTNAFAVILGDPVGATIKGWIISYTSLAFTGPTSLVTDLNATGKADVMKVPTKDEVWIAYQRSGTNDLRLAAFTNALAANGANTSAELPSQAIGWLNWDGSDGQVFVAFVSAATGAKLLTITISTLGIAATTTMDAAVTAAANVTGYVTTGPVIQTFIEVRAAATYNALVRYWPGSGATVVYERSVGIFAGVFKVGTRYFLPLTYESSLQSAYYVTDVTQVNTNFAPITVLRALYGLGGGLTAAGCIGKVGAISSTVAGLCALRVNQNPGGTKILGPCLLRIDFAATSISGPKRIGDGLHLPGGSVRLYDGLASPELGFYIFPEVPTLAQAVGGALTLLGAYQYAICYTWQDARGQLHRSAPSPLASVTLTGVNNQVALTIPTLRISQKDSTNPIALVYIEVYRTVAGGTTFFRVNTATPALISTQSSDTQAYTDTASDAAISANELLYTTGKLLPHICPPPARLMESWRNRLFLAGTENPNELWVSNEFSPDLGGVTFSDALVLQLEADGGPITALCEMDDRLVVFKRNSIYVLAGDGPVLTGDNQYHAPTRLTSVVGSVEQRGVVRTRDGVMFKSTRGIYLLAHTGAIIYAGAGVDAYNSLTVTGACVLEDEEQVRFTTAEGRTLVYHYGFPDDRGIGRWTTFTNQAAVDCIVWNGKFVRLASDGTVTEETIGSYADVSGTINAKVRLCWLNLTQFFGRFKLYGIQLLADMMASFTLVHTISYDYDATPVEAETKAVTVATLGPLQLSPARRRAVAVQVTLEESSNVEGFRLSGWGLEVGVEPGSARAGLEKKLA